MITTALKTAINLLRRWALQLTPQQWASIFGWVAQAAVMLGKTGPERREWVTKLAKEAWPELRTRTIEGGINLALMWPAEKKS